MTYHRQARARRTGRALVVAVGLTCLTSLPASGQQGEIGTGGVKGIVRDSIGRPVEGALIGVRGTDLHGESGTGGEFTLAKANAGSLTIHVRRIGFFPESATVTVLAGTTVNAEFTLRRVVVALQPVVILGRRAVTGYMAGFYQRLSRGHGHYFTEEQVAKRNPGNMTDLFRMVPGVRIDTRGFRNSVRFRGARCAPLTWLDGSPLYAGEFDLDSVDPRSFAGIEIYSGAASVPAEFQGNRSLSSACGTILLWSKQGELRPRKRKKSELSPAAEIAQLVQQMSVFTADQVDVQARVDSARIARPVYPDSLFNNLVPGTVVAEFVVDAGGRVNLDTFNVVTATNAGFIDAVRRSLRDQAFIPAMRKGQQVQQVVQLPFSFVPDSTAIRRR